MKRRTYLRAVTATGVAGGAGFTGLASTARAQEVCEEWSQAETLAGPDADGGDRVGSSVALDGETALVGAPNDEEANGPGSGSAHVFVQAGGGWTHQAKLVADDGDVDHFFGTAVALSGDTALVGAPEAGSTGGGDTGAVYVFERSDGTWSQQTKLASGESDAQSLGTAVELAGDTALVTAPTDNDGDQTNVGAAYVFERTDGVWSQAAKLTASDGEDSDGLGFAAGFDGSRAVLGTNQQTASAYVFERAGGEWTEQATLTGDEDDDRFGVSVGVDGDRTLVGTLGAAYVFEQSGSAWSQTAKFTGEDAAPFARFGRVVALDGGTAVVGAWNDENTDGDTTGAVYVYERFDGAWSQTTRLLADDGAADDRFGAAVDLVGDGMLVGAPRVDSGGEDNVGQAYVFGLSEAEGPPPIAGDNPPGNPTGDCLYRDVDGDGDFDIFDVQALFSNLDNPTLQDNAEYFNFSGSTPEEVTIFDVQGLFNDLQET